MAPFNFRIGENKKMKCVTPMYRAYLKSDPSTGWIISRQKAMEYLEIDNNYFQNNSKLTNDNKYSKYGIQKIPCKKCWACQLNYSAEWATRIMLEAKKSECNWFITLTYDDKHLPVLEELVINCSKKRKPGKKKIILPDEEYINDGTWTASLYPQHMVTFLNSLRKHFERKGYKGIKYFYCGEYGENTHRPHYHIILMHCPLDPNQFYDCHVDTNFKAHWKSKEIEKYWDKGIMDLSELEWSCAAYVARYCTKKLSFNTDKTEYYENGKIPEFVRMSKGIGFDYLNKNYKEIYKNDEIIMRTIKGNIGSAKPPSAFDRKLQEANPDLYEKIKESRKISAERAEKIINTKSDYTEMEKLIIEAQKVKEKMSVIPRVGEW